MKSTSLIKEMPVVERIRRFLATVLAWRRDFRAIGRNTQLARAVVVAGRQAASRSGAGSGAPRNRPRKINHSPCLLFSTFVVILYSGQAVHLEGETQAVTGVTAQSHGTTRWRFIFRMQAGISIFPNGASASGVMSLRSRYLSIWTRTYFLG